MERAWFRERRLFAAVLALTATAFHACRPGVCVAPSPAASPSAASSAKGTPIVLGANSPTPRAATNWTATRFISTSAPTARILDPRQAARQRRHRPREDEALHRRRRAAAQPRRQVSSTWRGPDAAVPLGQGPAPHWRFDLEVDTSQPSRQDRRGAHVDVRLGGVGHRRVA